MKVEGFAVDIDGTMTDDQGRVNLDAAHSLRWLEELGHKVILATGRGTYETLALSSFIGTTRMVVCENGGVVARSPSEMALLGDKAIALEAYDHLSARLPDVRLRQTFPKMTEVLLERSFDLELGRKVLGQSGIPARLDDSGYAYHITHKDVNKARGLLFALRALKADARSFIAIGDSYLDVPMFDICGYSITLANADERVKERADHTTAMKGGEGLVEALQHVAEKFLKVSLGSEQ